MQEATSNPVSCSIPEAIQLEASLSGEFNDANKVLITFTPKGTSAEGQELELSVDGLDTRRCILVSQPLGLIRNDQKGSGPCDYNETIESNHELNSTTDRFKLRPHQLEHN